MIKIQKCAFGRGRACEKATDQTVFTFRVCTLPTVVEQEPSPAFRVQLPSAGYGEAQRVGKAQPSGDSEPWPALSPQRWPACLVLISDSIVFT